MPATRFIGWVLVLAGLGLALRDALAPWLDHERFRPISFGAVVAWSRIVPLIDAAARLFVKDIFMPLTGWLQGVWAFAVLLGLGVALLAIDRATAGPRRRR